MQDGKEGQSSTSAAAAISSFYPTILRTCSDRKRRFERRDGIALQFSDGGI